MINLFFVKNNLNIIITSYISDKFSDVIDKYRIKTQDNDENYYIRNGLNLNTDYSLSKLGLNDGCIITVTDILNVNGGILTALSLTDFSKNKFEEISFSKDIKNVPCYRLVKKGINIFGICKCGKCPARDKEVIARISQDKLDLVKEKEKSLCPQCGSIIIP